MTPTEIMAQVVGVLGVAVFVFLYHNKNMKNILRVKLLMDVLWATHYLLLGAYSGFGTNVVCCGRELIFMNNDKPLFKKKFWLWLFVAFCWVSAALTWRGWYCIIPATVSTMATLSFWQKNVTLARWIGLINNVLMFTYDIFVLSYMGMVGEVLAFFSVISALIMAAKKNKS